MLEHLHNPKEASYLLSELAEKIVVHQGDVITKLNYIDRVVTVARTPVLEEDAVTLKELMNDPSMAKYFKGDPAEHLKSGNYRAIAAISTEAHLKGVISYVAASGLIFAHSLLEESLDTTLKITRLVDIEPWLGFVSDRTVTVGSILDKSVEGSLEDKVASFVSALRRDGILKQIDMLAKILRKSITKSHVRDYNYDRERIASLDELRHELAHRRSIEYTIDNARKDVRYLQLTALHFLDLVTFKYDLHGANRPKSG
jgi:hypothetical protein